MDNINNNKELRYALLQATRYDVENAKKCYDFVQGDEAQEPAKPGLADGLYYVIQIATGDRFFCPVSENLSKEQQRICVGIGIKQGDKRLTVAIKDAVRNEDGEASLTTQAGGKRFIEDFHEAVADWDGQAGTDDLANIINEDIELGEKWYIPSLGQMYFILAHFKEINEALAKIEGAEPLADDVYWTSTSYSAAYAWRLYLYDGGALSHSKASTQRRVRAVSAFLH